MLSLNKNKLKQLKLLIFVILILVFLNLVSASSRVVNPQYVQPGFTSYYSSELYRGSGAQFSVYWPGIAEAEKCEARQDFLISIAPAGCIPSVVRSDLLAEQNVPVFCQLSALKVNPLIEVDAVSHVVLNTDEKKYVAGVGFHPARAAIRTKTNLLGSPLINNIGYVVIVLKKMPEKEMPKWVEGNLSAYIRYDIDKAGGIGRHEFYVPYLDDEEWNFEYKKYSFWDGKGYLRLDWVENNKAGISIYTSQEKRIAKLEVEKGKLSREIYLPGFYCRAGLQAVLNSVEVPETSVELQIDNEIVQLTKNSRFLDSRCSIADIKSYGKVGEIEIYCPGEKFTLRLNPADVKLSIDNKEDKFAVGEKINKRFLIYAGELPKSVFLGEFENSFIILGKEYDDKLKREINSILRTFEAKKKDSVKIEEFKKELSKKNFEVLLKNEVLAKNKEEKIKFLGFESSEKIWQENIENNFKNAIQFYKDVVAKYPYEKEEGKEFFGEEALKNAEKLAFELGKKKTYNELLEKHVAVYDTTSGKEAEKKLRKYEAVDLRESSNVVFIDNIPHYINLIEIKQPTYEQASVVVKYHYKEEGIEKSKELYLQKGDYIKNTEKESVQLIDFDENEAEIKYDCIKKIDKETKEEKDKEKVKIGGILRFCDESIYVDNINLKKNARVSLIPKAYNQEEFTNFSFKIGIEKRSIKLSDEKTEEMIANLDKSIKKWEGITSRLGNTVSVMKGACLATSAGLIAKNLILGFSGEASARKEVMKTWKQKCEEMVAKGNFTDLTRCYANPKNAKKIEKDIGVWKKHMEEDNKYIKGIEEDMTTKVFFGENIVDTGKSRERYCESIKDLTGKGKSPVDDKKELVIKDVLEKCKEMDMTYEEMKRIKMNDKIIKDSKSSEEIKEAAEKDLGLILLDLQERNKGQEVSSEIGKVLNVEIDSHYDPREKFEVKEVRDKQIFEGVEEKIVNYNEYFGAGKLEVDENQKIAFVSVKGAKTIMNVLKTDDGKDYQIQKSYYVEKSGEKVNIIKEAEIPNIKYMRYDETTYNNKYINPKAKYFGTEPYRGMPAVVPFDIEKGWYAGVKQTLPIFGNPRSYDASGRVSSFWVCNVGRNGIEQFNQGMGDDICRQINLEAGQPINVFPGLKPEQAGQIARKAIRALEEASSQSGKTKIKITGVQEHISVEPAVNVPGMECQDMMSVKDCQLLFNVCDPVVCPSSRCNLGGEFYVSNVIQSGIIGGITLCLPNFGNPLTGGVVIPLCLSGIHAGLDSFVQILKQERDCLNESLVTGNYVGICDQLTAVYKCEFFWREIAPFLNNLIPRIVSWAYGMGTRGGGEYMSVMDAWKNAEDSISYFRDYYGKNSFNAFKMRSMEEAGTEVCKAFVSVSYPKSFKTLLEPDSPSQFHAWFDEIPYTSATIPPTSHYKVFFIIYAGKEKGDYYSVYLKRSSEEYFYETPGIYVVETGFVGKGSSVSRSKDFTAPSNYKELCVRIGLQEECGFKQVSTSFALNYLKDKYVKEQATQTDIKTEKECISGARSLEVLGTPASLGEYAGQALFPELEERGIVRICSTRNPGENVEPDRWQKAGYCDEKSVGCWLDKNSIKESLTSGDVGALNSTLKELENSQLKEAERLGIAKTDEELIKLASEISKIKTMTSEQRGEKISEAEGIENKAVYSYQKAHALFLKARIYEEIIRNLISLERKEEKVAVPSVPTAPVKEAEKEKIKEKKTYRLEKPVMLIDDKEAKIAYLGDKIVLKIKHDCDKVKCQLFSQDKFLGIDILDPDDEETKPVSCNEINDALIKLNVGKYYVKAYCYKNNNVEKTINSDVLEVKLKQAEGVSVV